MPDQQSILAIFDLLENNTPITPGARKIIDNVSKSYPYFLPARYIKAADIYRKEGYSNAYHSLISGYTGNIYLLNEYLNAMVPGGSAFVPEIDPFADTHEGDVSYKNKKSGSIYDEPIDEELTLSGLTHDDSNQIQLRDRNLTINTPPPVQDVEDAVIDDIYDSKSTETEHQPVEDEHKSRNAQEEADALIRDFLAKQNSTVEEVGDEKHNTETEEVVSHSHHEETEQHAVVHSESEKDNESHYETVSDETSDLVSEPEVHVEADTNKRNLEEDGLIQPVFTEDYFMQQGVEISSEVPEDLSGLKTEEDKTEEDKSLMVMMSFEEWLIHFKRKEETQFEEKKEQKALKTMWQKEKLAAAMEEENEEIPEEVFEVAMNSIAREDSLASESLAEIYTKQGKYDKALDMYRKLSLRNPEKSAYFARKIEEITKENLS